jgi:hypothetical protein
MCHYEINNNKLQQNKNNIFHNHLKKCAKFGNYFGKIAGKKNKETHQQNLLIG